MTDALEKELQDLLKIDSLIIDLGKQMLREKAYPLDYLAGAVMNRSLSLINGFVALTKANNFLCAAHLIRPHLDNFLRFHAAWLVSDPHEFADLVMNGARIDKLKDKDGKMLKDWYLADRAVEHYPWMKDVYEDTSGFVHLSGQHIKSSIVSIKEKEETKVYGSIGREDRFIPDEWKIEATQVMIEISNAICALVNGWIMSKDIKTS